MDIVGSMIKKGGAQLNELILAIQLGQHKYCHTVAATKTATITSTSNGQPHYMQIPVNNQGNHGLPSTSLYTSGWPIPVSGETW